MANCEMCGKESELFVTEIEGTRMNVCSGCAGFGKKIRRIAPQIKERKKEKQRKVVVNQEPEIIEMIVEDYPAIIRKKREKMGKTQKEFARLIAEKESLLHSIEVGKFEPSMELARKLERILNVRLIEKVEETKPEPVKSSQEESGSFTLGDFIKKR